MRRTRKRPWYKNPAWLVSIAAVLVALGLVLFFLLRSGGKKEPVVPDNPPVVDPTPAPDPTPTPDPDPEPDPDPTPQPSQGSYTEGEQTDGVWNLVLVNPWNPLPENFSVDIEPLDNTVGVDKRCYPQLQKMMGLLAERPQDLYLLMLPGFLLICILGVMIFCGLRGNRMDQKHCLRTIHSIRQKGPTTEEYNKELQEKGGVNMSIAMCMLVCYLIISWLPLFI